MQRRGPEPCDFRGVYNLTLKNLLICVDSFLGGRLFSEQFILIDFVEGRPVKPVIEIQPIDSEFFYDLHSLLQQQIPGLLFAVV